MRDSIHSARGSAVLREPDFDSLFVAAKRPRKLRAPRREVHVGLLQRVSARRMADIIAALVAAAAVLLVFVNALAMQKSPHPSPQVAKPAAVETVQKRAAAVPAAPLPQARPDTARRTMADLMLDVQRELANKGYYDGAVDGLPGPRVVQAIKNFEKAQGLKVTGEPNEALLDKIRRAPAKSDITGSISPASPVTEGSRIASVQRALARYGYGPVRITGELDKDTRAAIERFERDRDLPVSGGISDKLLRELASYSGDPLD